MKTTRGLSLLIAIVLILSNTATVFGQLLDTEKHWAEEVVEYMVDKGIIHGYPDGSFRPENNMTKAEFYKVVNELVGYAEKSEIDFEDVGENDWYYEHVQKGVKAKYIDKIKTLKNVELSEDTDLTKLTASDFEVTATDSKATVGAAYQDGSAATWKVNVEAEDDTHKDYTIKITVKLAKIELTVIEPVDGEAPDFNVNPLGVGYSAKNIRWYVGNTDTEATTFEAGQEYRLRMNISINIGYSFDEDASKVYFNGKEVTVGNVNGSTLENVYYIFTAK